MKKKENNIGALLLIALVYIISVIIAIKSNISISKVITNYQFNVLIIMIIMELFTNLVSLTGIMELISIKISKLSKGNKKTLLILFGLLMFIISAFLNNITAVLMILPIIFVLLKTIGIDKKYLNLFFAVILSLSNTGGASSPIGDFPAIVIMNSGITSFLGYLLRAFPFFLITSIILIIRWSFNVKKENENIDKKLLAIDILQSKYKHLNIKKDVVIGLSIIFLIMFILWSFMPQDILPPEIIAILGYAVATVFCSLKKQNVNLNIDFKPVLTISSFLFLASVISETGILNIVANYLQVTINDPKILLITIMLITSVLSGIFGAGPATSAMMPIIINLCASTFQNNSDWVAIGYAASICAGSSLFMWSATAGFILSKKIDEANLIDNKSNKNLIWNIGSYLKYGLQNYLIQISLAILIIYFVI